MIVSSRDLSLSLSFIWYFKNDDTPCTSHCLCPYIWPIIRREAYICLLSKQHTSHAAASHTRGEVCLCVRPPRCERMTTIKLVCELHHLITGMNSHMTIASSSLYSSRSGFLLLWNNISWYKVTIHVSLLSWKKFKHVSYQQLNPFSWPVGAACGDKKHTSWWKYCKCCQFAVNMWKEQA